MGGRSKRARPKGREGSVRHVRLVVRRIGVDKGMM